LGNLASVFRGSTPSIPNLPDPGAAAGSKRVRKDRRMKRKGWFGQGLEPQGPAEI
jgi:hypothetical protein